MLVHRQEHLLLGEKEADNITIFEHIVQVLSMFQRKWHLPRSSRVHHVKLFVAGIVGKSRINRDVEHLWSSIIHRIQDNQNDDISSVERNWSRYNWLYNFLNYTNDGKKNSHNGRI